MNCLKLANFLFWVLLISIKGNYASNSSKIFTNVACVIMISGSDCHCHHHRASHLKAWPVWALAAASFWPFLVIETRWIYLLLKYNEKNMQYVSTYDVSTANKLHRRFFFFDPKLATATK